MRQCRVTETGRPDIVDINIHKAYKEWARGAPEAYNSEDAYRAGYELALRVRDEESRRADNPALKSLRALSEISLPFG